MKIDGNILYAPCPCGSGKKFKFCCMQTVRDYLPDNPTQAEVTTEVRKAMQIDYFNQWAEEYGK